MLKNESLFCKWNGIHRIVTEQVLFSHSDVFGFCENTVSSFKYHDENVLGNTINDDVSPIWPGPQY